MSYKLFSEMVKNGNTENLFALVCISIITVIFIIITKLAIKKTPEYKKEDKKNKILFLLSCFSLLSIMMLAPSFSMFLKMTALIPIFAYASLSDIQKREVNDAVHIAIMLLGLGGLTIGALVSKFLAGFIMFIFMFVLIAILKAMRQFGGADFKFIVAMTFFLGMTGGITGLMIGLIAGIIITPIINRKKSKEEKRTLPFIPYLSFGYYISILLLMLNIIK